MPDEVFLSRSGRFLLGRLGGLDGFALSGPFDDILRRLTAPWLASTWAQLTECLHTHGFDPGRLRWGTGHPAYSLGSADVDRDSPLGFFGWVMPANRRAGESLWQQHDPYRLTELGERIEQNLRRAGVGVTVAGADIRGAVFTRVVNGVDVVAIPSGDTDMGLELLVDHEMGERLTVTFRADMFRRPGWVTMALDLDGAEGRWEHLSLANVSSCLDALRRQHAPARLTSLGHASELVLEPGRVHGHLTAGPDAGMVEFSVPVPTGALSGLTAALEHLLP